MNTTEALALVEQIARMTLTDDADGVDLDNDTAMDGLIRRARNIVDGEAASPSFMEDYDDDEPRCTDPGGHEWPRDIEERDRCLCIHCGADGDA